MEIRQSIEIGCTPAALWPCLTQPELLKDWVPGFVDEVPEDPAVTSGVGAASLMRLREGAKVSTYRSEVTRWEPERAVAIRMSGGSFAQGMHMDVAYEVTPTARGCRLDFHERCDMKGFFVLLAPIFWLVGRSNTHKALANLSRVAMQRAA